MLVQPSDYLDLEDLTPGNILLLQQAYARLRAEGKLMFHNGAFAEFLDIVMARGDYDNTDSDYVFIDDEIREKRVKEENILTEYED